MYPDNIHHQAPGQDSLPQVQNAPAGVSAAVAAQQPIAAAGSALPHASAEPLSVVEQVNLLTKQYAANPFAFNAAFQQLKSRYLLQQYHIDPSMDKK